MEVAFVHKNEFGVLEVIRPFAQRVHELEVAQVSTEIIDRLGGRRVGFPAKSWPNHMGSKRRAGR